MLSIQRVKKHHSYLFHISYGDEYILSIQILNLNQLNKYKKTVKYEWDIYNIASESEAADRALGGEAGTGIRNRRARMVDISSSTGCCPNCNGKLIPLLLNEDEKKRVRLGLMKIASTCSILQLRNIQVF